MLYMLVTAALLALLSPCAANTVQGDWTFPQSPDSTSVLTSGSAYKIAWTSSLKDWFSIYCTSCDTTNVDLWVTSSSDKMEHLIACKVNSHEENEILLTTPLAAIDVTSTISYVWTVDIPTSEIASSSEWVFRFVASGAAGTASQQISSSVFDIVESDITTATATTTTTQATTTQSTTLTTSTTSATTTASDTSASSSSGSATTTSATSSGTSSVTDSTDSGLSVGAKAGISIGAIAGAFILVALGMALARRNRSNHSYQAPATSNDGFSPPAPNMSHGGYQDSPNMGPGGYGASGAAAVSHGADYPLKESYATPPPGFTGSPYAPPGVSPPPASHAELHGHDQRSTPSELPYTPYHPQPSELGS
jgi:hypothetical protein